MSGSAQDEYSVVDPDGQAVYATPHMERAVGVKEYLEAENGDKYKVTKTVLV